MPRDLSSTVGRVWRAVEQRRNARRLRGMLTLAPRPDLEKIGTSYGGCWIPASELSGDSACYLAGLGEDASFDLGLIQRFGCTVYALDPVPEAATYAKGVSEREPRFRFMPVRLWSSDTTLRFYDNPEPGFVSRSATNMHHTGGYTEANVRALERAGCRPVEASLPPFNWKLTFCTG
jgi:hypothetical protein